MSREAATSPRINDSDYDGTRDRGKMGKSDIKNRRSGAQRASIFPDEQKTPALFCGCPRWGWLVLIFVIFGAFSGVIAWLIVKNETFNTLNPELRIQYDRLKWKLEEERKKNMLENSALAVISKTQAIVNQHQLGHLHYYVQN